MNSRFTHNTRTENSERELTEENTSEITVKSSKTDDFRFRCGWVLVKYEYNTFTHPRPHGHAPTHTSISSSKNNIRTGESIKAEILKSTS